MPYQSPSPFALSFERKWFCCFPTGLGFRNPGSPSVPHSRFPARLLVKLAFCGGQRLPPFLEQRRKTSHAYLPCVNWFKYKCIFSRRVICCEADLKRTILQSAIFFLKANWKCVKQASRIQFFPHRPNGHWLQRIFEFSLGDKCPSTSSPVWQYFALLPQQPPNLLCIGLHLFIIQ